MVIGLAEQYGLQPGSKVYVDNLFTSMDLLDHMGERNLGVTGTMRQNRIIGIPLPGKKEASKKFERGEVQTVYTSDCTVLVWKDNQPVYMASNFDQVEPLGSCQRYSKKDRKYVAVPQPNINQHYNKFMGWVDLVDNSEKNYSITTRVKKWYWCLYTWFLNISMVQAWRLYRAHMKEQHRLIQVEEDKKEAELEKLEQAVQFTKSPNSSRAKKQREKEQKKRRVEEKKVEEISLLEFTRDVVDMTFKNHGTEDSIITSQKEASAMLVPGTLEQVRFDSGRHLVKLTSVAGVCKQCKLKLGKEKRTKWRCDRCNVALHCECFFDFHVLEENDS